MAVTPEEQKNARRKAMLLLEHMDRTEKGLSDRLRQAGFSAEATEDAMNYVRSYGYLNDYRYAMNYISFRMGTKSRQKILQELSGKGIDRETVLAAWEEAAEIVLNPVEGVRYTVPSTINPVHMDENLTERFRVGGVYKNCYISVYFDEERVIHKKRPVVAPGEMEQIKLTKEQLMKYPGLKTITVKIEEA